MGFRVGVVKGDWEFGVKGGGKGRGETDAKEGDNGCAEGD